MSAPLIINPSANAGRCAERVRSVRALIADRWPDLEWIESESADHVTRIASDAASAGCPHVFVAGGDGTVLSAAMGVVGTETALGILPTGTGNDVAVSVEVPTRLEDAIAVLADGEPRRYDVGQVGSRIFCCVLGVGMDDEALHYINAARWIRRGRLLYNYAAIRSIFAYRPRRMRISCGDAFFDAEVLFAAATNTRSYGGGMRIAPDAEIDDGRLDLCVLPHTHSMGNLLTVASALSGRHRNRPGVVLAQGPRITMESDEPLPVTLDGELTDLKTPIEVGVLPGALRVLGRRTPKS